MEFAIVINIKECSYELNSAKVRSQETTGITGKFGLGVQNKGKGQQSFAKTMHWS